MNSLPLRAVGRFAQVAADLAERGWSACADFAPPDLTARLRNEAQRLSARGAFQPAAVGSGAKRGVNPGIRGDETCWLAERQSPVLDEALECFEQLRRGLNRELQLGLFEFEAHLARYRPGSAYAAHFDRFAGSTRRILSVVLYLNENWRAEEGGALRLYGGAKSAQAFHDVLPQDRQLVLFLSERFEHEVLPATRERLSLSGWFLARA